MLLPMMVMMMSMSSLPLLPTDFHLLQCPRNLFPLFLDKILLHRIILIMLSNELLQLNLLFQ